MFSSKGLENVLGAKWKADLGAFRALSPEAMAGKLVRDRLTLGPFSNALVLLPIIDGAWRTKVGPASEKMLSYVCSQLGLGKDNGLQWWVDVVPDREAQKHDIEISPLHREACAAALLADKEFIASMAMATEARYKLREIVREEIPRVRNERKLGSKLSNAGYLAADIWRHPMKMWEGAQSDYFNTNRVIEQELGPHLVRQWLSADAECNGRLQLFVQDKFWDFRNLRTDDKGTRTGRKIRKLKETYRQQLQKKSRGPDYQNRHDLQQTNLIHIQRFARRNLFADNRDTALDENRRGLVVDIRSPDQSLLNGTFLRLLAMPDQRNKTQDSTFFSFTGGDGSATTGSGSNRRKAGYPLLGTAGLT